MEMLKIKKSIDIPASKEQVWKVLLTDELMRNWYSEFSEGSHAVTDWKEGSKVIFKDKSENGMIGRVAVHKPQEALVVTYEGMLTPQGEDYESEAARQVKGGQEAFYLKGVNGHTHLDIESDMTEEFFEAMSKAWDKALLQISKLAVSQQENVADNR
jgi:uncharacterized protein YndB with AHSA1/START domain